MKILKKQMPSESEYEANQQGNPQTLRINTIIPSTSYLKIRWQRSRLLQGYSFVSSADVNSHQNLMAPSYVRFITIFKLWLKSWIFSFQYYHQRNSLDVVIQKKYCIYKIFTPTQEFLYPLSFSLQTLMTYRIELLQHLGTISKEEIWPTP